MIDRICVAAERMEHDDLVDAVQELRAEVLPQHVHHLPARAFAERRVALADLFRNQVAADVGGHDYDAVLEVDGSALPVGEPPVVEQLQHDVEHFRMRLLDLVEQDNGVGAAPDGFGQLS